MGVHLRLLDVASPWHAPPFLGAQPRTSYHMVALWSVGYNRELSVVLGELVRRYIRRPLPRVRRGRIVAGK
jgi:hypothetical protein